VRFGRTDALVDELAGYGPDVVAREPGEVRELLVTRLRAVLGTPVDA
jgi:predicted DNA-binding transcriptional regulator YafY